MKDGAAMGGDVAVRDLAVAGGVVVRGSEAAAVTGSEGEAGLATAGVAVFGATAKEESDFCNATYDVHTNVHSL